MRRQELDTLDMVYKELWGEIRARRVLEHTVCLAVSGFFSAGLVALAAAHMRSPHESIALCIKCAIGLAVLIIASAALFFIWKNHGKYQQVARVIVKFQDKLDLYEDKGAELSVLPLHWKQWGQPGTGRWGPGSYSVILGTLTVALCILVTKL